MLRVSKLTDYATVILTHIAHQPDELHTASDITSETGVALPTVSNPSETNVAEIIIAIEGPISMTECSTSSGICEQEPSCEIKGNWHLINRAVYTAIEAVSLADMITPVKQQAVKISLPRNAKLNDLKVES